MPPAMGVFNLIVSSSSLSTFPLTTEAFPSDFFTIRSSNVTNPFHAFSSTGSYYCAKNIYCGDHIYLGVDPTSNSDPVYMTRSNLSSNITEISAYIGDDGTNSISVPSGETNNVDYFSIRSINAGLHHIFSSTGSYYAANNINGIIIPKNSGCSIAGVNGNYNPTVVVSLILLIILRCLEYVKVLQKFLL